MPSSKPSKSARKREYLALQALGEELIDLTAEQLGNMSLDEALLDAVLDAKGINSHGALRRQKQLIGKLMRETDPDPIRAALHEFGRHDIVAKDVFRASEKWRDRIAAEGSAVLPEFFELIGGENETIHEQTKSYEAATHHKERRLIRRRIFAEVHKELASKMQNTTR